MALNFDFENIRTTEFGIGRDDEDTRVFHLMSVDAGVQTALQEMAKSSWESMQAISQNPDKYEPAEKYATHEYLYIGLNEDLAKSMKELYEANNLPVDMASLSDPKKVFCYFARMTDNQGRRLTAVRRAAQFKGALKARLIQLTTDSLRLIEDHVFKLDSDFDLIIDSVNVSILRPSGFEYTAQLEEAILQSVPKNLEAVQRELSFVNFTNIQEFAGKHPRAARYLASIRSQKEMKNINQKLLQKTCRVTGVQFKVVDGKIVVPEWHVMGFLEVLDRRRYEVNLVKGLTGTVQGRKSKEIGSVMGGNFTESIVEEASLAWLEELGWELKHGPEIAPGETNAERQSYQEAILPNRLRRAIEKLNPKMPTEAIEEAYRKVSRVDSPSLIQSNQIFHRILVNGVDVEYRGQDRVVYDIVRLADFENPDNNDWVAVNQFTVEEGQHNRRPDIVLFLNGLPIAVIELKNPADENATIWSAFNQFQTYKQQISSLFRFNEILIVSDGLEARFGSLTSNKEWFLPWRTIEGDVVAASSVPQLDVLVKGLFEKKRFLQYLRYFVVFEEETKGVPIKKLAGYHQFYAVNVAVEETVRASRITAEAAEEQGTYYAKRLKGGTAGDRRVGVVWHTQGSGKSLTMAFYAGRVIQNPAMENPTLIVLTDRNDLDDQLYGTFSRCKELLRQTPAQAKDRENLRELLKVVSGGVIFTTIQKFMPEEKGDRHPVLSDRSNIVVIADEAHRSQYDFLDGFARHMRDAVPNASFIGFTGTPIELADKNTRSVFGDYISIYDIQRAVQDGATVPIYYEGRLAKLELRETEKPKLDDEFEEITEGEEEADKEKLKTKWAALEAVVGSEKRVNLIARDIVSHFEARLEVMDGKAMIVCMSRRIGIEIYKALIKLKPEWHNENDDKGSLKVVMTGSATDPLDWQQHIRNKSRREALAKRFKDPADPLKLVIVRDMWLTGFDAPCLHTLYADKPMRGHSLMQAIARVNRVFKDKPGGLVVDYLGLADFLRKALAVYTESGGKGDTAIDQGEAVAVMLEKYEICCGLFHKFDWSLWTKGTPSQKLGLLPSAQEHILAQEDGKNRLLKAVTDLSKAFALSVPHEKSIEIRDDVAFFQAVRSVLAKSGSLMPDKEEDMEHAIRQLISQAVASDKVIDIFAAAGLKKPDISVLSDDFLAEVRGLPQKNLAVELLRKLLNEEIKQQSRKNLIQSKLFSEMLEKTIRAYQNRALEAAQIIEQLISLAKDMKQAQKRGEKLGLTDDEIAFYDALEVNDSAVKVMGDSALQTIARELVETVRNNVSIDWTVKESVRAKLRVMVKRILKKYGYPPDLQEKATQTVLEQAELIAKDWVS